jgi:hypothetical protein
LFDNSPERNVEEESNTAILEGFNLIKPEELSVGEVISDPQAAVLVLINVMSGFETTFFSGYLALYLSDTFKLDTIMVGATYGVFALVYVICCIVAPIILSNVPQKL